MAAAHVQADWDVKPDPAGTTHVYASGLTVTTGNLIAVFIKYRGTLTATITDNFSNSYTQTPTGYIDNAGDDGLARNRGAMFYARNITGGANYTITITYSDTLAGGAAVLAFHEISGTDATAPLVANAGNPQAAPGTGANAITSTAATPSAANAYIFGGFSGAQGGTTVTAGTSPAFSAGVNIGALAGLYSISTEYFIQGAAASVAATFTSSGALTHTITMMAAFKPSGGAPTNYPLTLDGTSYGVTGADAGVQQSSPLTWLRVGR